LIDQIQTDYFRPRNMQSNGIKRSLRPGNARLQKWQAWKWCSHAFLPTLTQAGYRTRYLTPCLAEGWTISTLAVTQCVRTYVLQSELFWHWPRFTESSWTRSVSRTFNRWEGLYWACYCF